MSILKLSNFGWFGGAQKFYRKSPWIFLAEFKTSRCQEASQVYPQGMALLKATAQAGSPRFDADPMFPMKFWPFGGYILFSDTHHPMFILVTNCVFLAVDDLFLVVAGFWFYVDVWCVELSHKNQCLELNQTWMPYLPTIWVFFVSNCCTIPIRQIYWACLATFYEEGKLISC